jgi:hypothetical protein
MRIFLIIYLLCCFILPATAQVAKQDSVSFYRNIEDFADKRKVTKWIHRLFFRPVPATAAKTVRKEQKRQIDPYYRRYENKVIRSIEITTLDPFGYSLKDTSVVPHNFIKNAGNALHNKSARSTIRHFLMFKEGDRFDSLVVRDSERIIRSQRYVRDVIFTFSTSSRSDSVDIYIRVMDVWSIIVEGSLTSSRLSPDITERNFMGLGHRLEYKYNDYYNNGDYNMSFNYSINNISRSFVNAGLYHFRNSAGNRVFTASLDRPFYSVFAKWAGGIYISNQKSELAVLNEDSAMLNRKVRGLQTDYWLGRQWKMFKGSSADNRSTNFVLSARYANLHYYDYPVVSDTVHTYNDDYFYLVGAGVSMRKYISDKYVFKYGDGEDIPSGKAYGIVGGYHVHADETDWYLGMKISWGNYYPWGYFSALMEYGTYTNIRQFNQGVATLELNYFTDLLEAGRWKFRQFIKPRITIGISRLPSERISLNDDSGIQGFNSEFLTGTKRIVVTFQTQSYAPWRILGFRFGPYMVFSAGMLADEGESFRGNKVYTQLGMGLLIKNEYLVLNTFQVSVAFYPLIPGEGRNVFKKNPVKTTDYGLRDFDFSRPGMVSYQ